MKVIHERPQCIGCGACASLCPKFWKMDTDGLATLVEGEHTENGNDERTFEISEAVSQDDLKLLKQTEDVCPVNVIKISDKPT